MTNQDIEGMPDKPFAPTFDVEAFKKQRFIKGAWLDECLVRDLHEIAEAAEKHGYQRAKNEMEKKP
jgi:hypothetical protein